MNITRKDLPKAKTQAQSLFNNEFLKVFKQCKRKPTDIAVLKETLKKAHSLCLDFQKLQEAKEAELTRRQEEKEEARKEAEAQAIKDAEAAETAQTEQKLQAAKELLAAHKEQTKKDSK